MTLAPIQSRNDFIKVVSTLIEDTSKGRRPPETTVNNVFIGSDFKQLSQACSLFMLKPDTTPLELQEGALAALQAAGLILDTYALEAGFFCVIKKDRPYRLIFWALSW